MYNALFHSFEYQPDPGSSFGINSLPNVVYAQLVQSGVGRQRYHQYAYWATAKKIWSRDRPDPDKQQKETTITHLRNIVVESATD